jgi:hypothetical protein
MKAKIERARRRSREAPDATNAQKLLELAVEHEQELAAKAASVRSRR